MQQVPGRRLIIGALAGLVLAGCSSRPLTERPEGNRTIAPSTPIPSPPPVVRAAEASPEPKGRPVNPVPARDQIIASFGKEKPASWGLQVPGTVLSLTSGTAGIALTFDCCGGPGGEAFDVPLVKALRHHQIPATFFLNARWIKANGGLAQELADDPLFELANHGTRHLPLSVAGYSAYGIPGTRNAGEVHDEIMENQELLTELAGKIPRFFRSGTAYLDDVSVRIVRALGLVPVNFSINGDAGATFPAAAVAAALNAAKPRDIVIAHANQPGSGTAAGVAEALPALRERGTQFLRLSEAPL